MAQPINTSQPDPLQPEGVSPYHGAVFDACKEGRIWDLQRLFIEHGIKRGADPVDYSNTTQEGVPRTDELFASAISHGHRPIVEYLHSIYPKFNFRNPWIVHAILERPSDLEMLKLIYSWTPEVVRYRYSDHCSSFLSRAIEDGPENAPLVNFLVDHGAAEPADGAYNWRFGEALLPAIQYDQPVEVVKKMARQTTWLLWPIEAAISHKRSGALNVLLNETRTRDPFPYQFQNPRWLLSLAQRSRDKKVISLLERYVYDIEQQVAKSAAGESLHIRSEGSRSWWPFSNKAEVEHATDTDASGSSTIQTRASKWWLPLFKTRNSIKPTYGYEYKKDFYDSTSDSDCKDTTKHG